MAFINDRNQIDAVLNIDGDSVLLSELQDAGLIENCGWFKKAFKKIAKAVKKVCNTAVIAVGAVVGAGIAAGTAAASTAIQDGKVDWETVGICAGVGAAVGAVASGVAYGVTNAIKGAGSAADDVVNSADDVANSADDVAKGATSSADDVANGVANSADDVVGKVVAKYGDDFGQYGQYVKNPNIKVDWTKTTTHGSQRMAERNMTQSMVDDIVKNGKALSQNGGEKFLHLTKDGAAVVSKNGELITAYTKNEFKPAMIELLTKLGIL